jgi:hypothetical protein
MSPNREFTRWESEAWPILSSLLAVFNVAQRTTHLGPAAMLSVSDQLMAVSHEALDWMPGHRCPVVDLDVRFTQVTRSIGNAGKILESEAKDPRGPDLLAIEREMNGLHAMIAFMLTMISDLDLT